MQSMTNIEKLFSVLNDTAEIIAKELNMTYIEALSETGENIFHDAILQDDLSEVAEKGLQKKYESIHLTAFSKEEMRKAYQLAILKGLKEGASPNHQMTPDSIGIFLAYLVSKFVGDQKELSILDPAVGTGNLLTTVLNSLQNETVESAGIDIDDLLVKLAYISSNLQEHPIQFFNQDSLEPLLVSPVDAVICDLPVGYYPNDEGAEKYYLKAAEGHSYAHHLFIEQSMNYTKEGGYLFFIVPNSIFSSKEAPHLNEYISKEAYIQAFIELPAVLFKDKHHAKSILVLQKQGENIVPPKQTMLIKLPRMTDKNAMRSIMKQMEDWFKLNK
ncbi:class I SAM-dependent methyltransferase [Metabacillus fastidiosus]|uniref:Class I SAM-dependent methyltransferase n=2 Tax=Metabacillus fastidiosus TaxID=1458 RepID=A0ABU6NXV1_9BACI|nr:class I SAM-dependent methyltransferase [Metabacillus fastidiosus]